MSLLAIRSWAITATAHPAATAVSAESPAITPTSSIELAPESGSFVDTLVSLPGVEYGSAQWGDCNNDGASDILLTGQVSSTLKIARVYQQQIGGGFTPAASFTAVMDGAAAWGDYDNDNWLDIALTGNGTTGPLAQVWHNDRNGSSCTFSLAAANLIGVQDSAVAWGDYDGDGQLDLLLAGNDGAQPVTKLYRNQHGAFTDSGLNLPGIQNGAAVWGDYNSDGWVDLLLTGSTIGAAPSTRIYRNDGRGALTAIQAGLPALRGSAAAWGDYDSDGDLDLLLEGTSATSMAVAEIYRNDQGAFVKNNDAGALLGSLDWTGAAWGDFDTDGHLDALISSNDFATGYRNEITGSFASGTYVGPSRLAAGTAVWGHYDYDRNLDVLLTGRSLTGPVTKIYRYSTITSSVPPEAPRNLAAAIIGSDVALHWSPPLTDDHTTLSGLTYNLRVGTQPGGIDIIAPMAITSTGYRLLPALGNVYQARTYTLRKLSLGRKYYWSVQAIDASFLGSSFASEGTFQIPYRVFLPALVKNLVSYYTAEWETEPNNTYLHANGALKTGRAYRGAHNDEKDYFSAYLQNAGTVAVDMVSPSGGTQIQLFYLVADAAHRVGFDPAPPYHITYTGAPGWYYIYVYTNPAYVGSQTYTLTATIP
jgi:hypothetical protein